MPTVTATRIEVVEGQKVLVFEDPSPLPASLDLLLGQMRITFRNDPKVGGMSSLCTARDHRLARFRDGRYLGPDGVVRDLRLLMCIDCETVCVRDISVDSLERTAGGSPVHQSRLAPRRRNETIGWYTGARRNQHTYR